jgi:hypothetical protein
VPVTIERAVCLEKSPPEMSVVPPMIATTECPANFTCLPDAEDRALTIYIRRLERYAKTAFTLCGPEPEKETP